MISLVTGAIGVLVGLLIIYLIRKDRLHVQHGFAWIVVAIGFSLLGFSPSLVDEIAKHLGVAYPPILALLIGMSLMVIKLLLMDIEHSRIEVRNQRLIQRVAILEARLAELSEAESTRQ